MLYPPTIRSSGRKPQTARFPHAHLLNVARLRTFCGERIQMEVRSRSSQWRTISSSGVIWLSVILSVLVLISIGLVRERKSRSASDQAEIEKMVSETNTFAGSIRCIQEQTWLLTSP